MKKIKFVFSDFISIALKILFIYIIVSSCRELKQNLFPSIYSNFSMIFLGIIVLFGGIVIYLIKKDYNKKWIITFILIIGLILRLIWFYSIDSIPTGDFNRMYICAEDFLNGSTSMFKGTSYMGRFPHMSITVLYFSFIQKIFYKFPLQAIRFINIIYSMINIVIIYSISKELFKNEKVSMGALFLASIYPPMIIYNNVYGSENMAMPLFLFSIYLFIKSINREKKLKLLILSAVFLSVGNLFRPIAYVALVAYLLYILIYFNENIKKRIVLSGELLLGFIIPTVIVSYSLIGLNILERPLWKPTEPASISILKGSNFESGGRWNEADAKVFGECGEDYEKADKRAKEIIKDRLLNSKTIDVVNHYTIKYSKQWRTGEFGGIGWSETGLETPYNRDKYLKILGQDDGKVLLRLSTDGEGVIQIIYVIMILLSYFTLYKGKRNYKLDFIYILFCGFSLQCLITESQDRYTYIVSWIFIFLAIGVFDNFKVSISKGIKGLFCRREERNNEEQVC